MQPYSHDEQRVVMYLHERMPEIGAGDDPIGFLIASHHALSEQVKEFRIAFQDIIDSESDESF